MISRVRFQNFKALADVAIDLPRLTVLVDANATGKTSVLEGLDLMSQLVIPDAHEEDPEEHAARVFRGRFAPEKLRTLGAAGPIEIDRKGDVELLCRLTAGNLHRERRIECLSADLSLLRSHDHAAGLTDLLDDIEAKLVPLFARSPSRPRHAR